MFVLFRVDADYAEYDPRYAGVGTTCDTMQEAQQAAARLERNEKYTNVKISEQRYGC